MKRSRTDNISEVSTTKKRKVDKASGFSKAVHWLLGWIVSPQTLLFFAAKQGNLFTVNKLIAYNVNLNTMDTKLAVAKLHQAIEANFFFIAEALFIALRDKGETLWDDMTPLHHAIKCGKTNIAQMLLNAGANKNALYQGMTPLHHAIHQSQPEVVQALIDAGANIMALYQGMTPLRFAIKNEKIEIYKCFSKRNLLKIVNNVHLIMECSHETIVMLYWHFNRKRKWDKSSTPLLDICYFSHKTAHVLGLEGEICFDENGMEFKLATRGGYAGDSLGYLTEYLQLYNEIYPCPLFEEIVRAFVLSNDFIDPYHNYYNVNAEFDFYNKYLIDQLVYFSSGWRGHTVGLAIYGNYLIYANRGIGGDDNSGCRIFKIIDKEMITPDLIRMMIGTPVVSEDEFHAILAEVVDLNSPVVSFVSKDQKHPTCTFANPKATIEAMIVLLQVGPSASIAKLNEQFTAEQGREKYKSFTSFVRNTMIDELIKNMLFEKNKYLLAFYAALTKKIISQHGGAGLSRSKDFDELMRACNLYTRLPSLVKELINKDHPFLQRMLRLNSSKKKIIEGASLVTTKPILHQMNQRSTNHHVENPKKNLTLKKGSGLGVFTQRPLI